MASLCLRKLLNPICLVNVQEANKSLSLAERGLEEQLDQEAIKRKAQCQLWMLGSPGPSSLPDITALFGEGYTLGIWATRLIREHTWAEPSS